MELVFSPFSGTSVAWKWNSKEEKKAPEYISVTEGGSSSLDTILEVIADGQLVLESLLECPHDLVPIVVIRRWSSSCVLIDSPHGPVLDPVFDVWSFDEPQ